MTVTRILLDMLRLVPRILAMGAILILALAYVDAQAQTTAFTYQGRLTDGGNPASGNYDLQFSLFDNLSGGSQIGSTQTRSSIAVSGGVFTVQLDFGVSAFPGANRFLEIGVRPASVGNFTTLSPRQQISSTPYAIRTLSAGTADALSSACVACVQDSQIGSVAGSKVSGLIPVGSVPANSTSYIQNGSATQSASFNVSGTGTVGGIFRSTMGAVNVAPNKTLFYNLEVDATGSSNAFSAQSESGPAINAGSSHSNAIVAFSDASGFASIYGENSRTGSFGVYGYANSGGASGAGVFGMNSNGAGIWGRSTNGGSGVYGEAQWAGGKGVYGFNSNINSSGVYGQADAAGSVGVYGTSAVNTGVYGFSGQHFAIWGSAGGVGGNAVAVYGDNGQRNDGSWAGYFNGNLGTNNRILAPSSAVFIDHPLDPQNKTLQHSFVASPEMLTIYSGTVTIDVNGEAIVTLPDYFEALNQDYRYQLTAVGAPGPCLFVAEEIKNNRFKVAGGSPGARVSWQVVGTRHDAFANQDRIQTEAVKPVDQRGKYLNPKAYGQPDSLSIVSKPSSPVP